MYRAYYAGNVLFDPESDERVVTDIACTLSLVGASTLTVTVPRTNPLSGTFEPMRRDRELSLERDGETVFRGRILTLDTDFFGNEVLTAESERSYLNDVLLPPFSTDGIAGLEPVPSAPADLFRWMVQQYNAKQDASHQFRFGDNQAWQLAESMQANETERRSVWEAIKTRLVSRYGGWVRVRYSEGLPYIDYLTDSNVVNAQTVEFGVNLLDYTGSRNGSTLYTRICPVSYEGETIANLQDGPVGRNLVKQGEYVINTDLEGRYGVIEYAEAFDTTNPNQLLQDGIMRMKQAAIGDSLTITAFDLALIDPSATYIQPGDYVRVVSPPHDVDEFFICWEREIHPTDPAQDTLNLGTTDIKLTTSQAQRLAALDDSISTVQSAAITSTVEQFYQSTSSSVPSGGTWSDTQPEWEDGKYIFRRTIVTYGDGTTETTPGDDGVCITGNTGEEGPQGPPGPGASALLATCTTAAATAKKDAVLADQTLTVSAYDGLTVTVLFQYANTASAPTLSLAIPGGGTIEHGIYTDGSNEAWWQVGTVATFVLDDTNGKWLTVNSPVYASEVTVGDAQAEHLHIDSNGLQLMDGASTLADVAPTRVSLGKNSTSAEVDFCGQKGTFRYTGTQLQLYAGNQSTPEDVVLHFPDSGGGARSGHAGEFWRSSIPSGAVFEANNTVNSLVGVTNIFEGLSGRPVPFPLALYKARRYDFIAPGGAIPSAANYTIPSGTITAIPLVAGVVGEVKSNPPYTDGQTTYDATGYFEINGSGELVCKRAGVVFVFASNYINASSGSIGTYVKHNGVEAATSGYMSGGNVRNATTVLEVAPGDVISLNARASASSVPVACSNYATFLLVMYIG